MNSVFKSMLALCCTVAFSACGRQEAAPMPVEDTVFSETVGAMDKARAVDDVTRQHKQDLDRAMEAAEGAP